MNLVLFGAPGAGKGTQGELLAAARGLLRLSTGDLLRDAVRRGTPLGLEAKRFMDAGELVPDDVILGLVREVLDTEAGRRGVIFDGFPRTRPQAEALDAMLAGIGRPLDAVVVLAVDDATIVRRLGGRLTCGACGAVFNRSSDPPGAEGVCDRCGGALVQREDDREETVRRRLRVYEEQTAPLLAYYETGPTPVLRVDGDRAVEAVQAELLEVVTP
jgi:adenylate kinase